jgi:DNA polymerase
MASTLSLDWETKSELDLTEVGIDLYSAHPSTEILMGAFKIDGQTTEQWVPAEGERIPTDLKEALRDPEVHKIGFNASFERLIAWRKLGLGVGDYASWRCSMALAYMFSFMGGLDDIAEQMDLRYKKSPRGKLLVRTFCGPNKPTKNQPFIWRDQHSDPELWEEFKGYNIRDEDTEWELWSKLIKFGVPDWQWELYTLDQIINDRGLPINRTFVQNALEIAQRRKAELISEQNRITGLANANSGPQLLPWLQERGYAYDNLQKANVVKMLAAEEEEVKNPTQTYDYTVKALVPASYPDAFVNALGQIEGNAILTGECRIVLRFRQGSSKTSTTKYEACITALGDDDRLRHCFQFAGGSRTNRWAGRKIQPQNLPRTPKWLEPEDHIDFDRLDYCNSLIEAGDYGTLGVFAGEQMDAVAGCVRSTIQAHEGKKLVVCDLSSIESVVIFWLTDCERGMNVFRNGLCAYKDFATTLYGVPYEEVTKSQRSGAKPAVLGAGYRLSGGELRDGEKTGLWAYAENMGVQMTREEANRAVAVFRETYSEIKNGWYQIEDTIERAMMAGGKIVKWGPLEFQIVKPFLRVGLPSGRSMWYYKLHVEKYEAEGRYGKYWRTNISYMGKDQVTNQWRRIESHGGKFIENFVQALARDILGFGMLAAHLAGFFIVGHVHDEIISEEDEDDDVHNVSLLRDCMTTAIQKLHSWLVTMPLGAAGYEAKVYRKD